jgi:hypothetical protein
VGVSQAGPLALRREVRGLVTTVVVLWFFMLFRVLRRTGAAPLASPRSSYREPRAGRPAKGGDELRDDAAAANIRRLVNEAAEEPPRRRP